jgi:hypothetical protein
MTEVRTVITFLGLRSKLVTHLYDLPATSDFRVANIPAFGRFFSKFQTSLLSQVGFIEFLLSGIQCQLPEQT